MCSNTLLLLTPVFACSQCQIQVRSNPNISDMAIKELGSVQKANRLRR